MFMYSTLLALVVFATFAAGTAPLTAKYLVRVNNLTFKQPFSPVLVVVHRPDIQLFEVGKPASQGLRSLAERGDGHPLAALLSSLNQVHGLLLANAPTAPGGEWTCQVDVRDYRPDLQITIVAMLVNTNDAFFALQGGLLPPHSQRFLVPAYDAGTELNNEMCEFIPGPACPHSPNLDTGKGEGFVHVHRGFQGIAEGRVDNVRPLRRSIYDWRNPVAQLEVIRIH